VPHIAGRSLLSRRRLPRSRSAASWPPHRAPAGRLRRRSRGSEGKKGRGGDVEAHPEDAHKADRDGGSRRTANRAAASSVSVGKKRSSAAFPGSSARLVRRRGRGRRGGPSGCAGGARGALPRRREATAWRLVSGVHAGRRNRGRERTLCRKKIRSEGFFTRDFYFRALRSLVVLSFPQPLSFSSVFPSL
jgi:hypothetical protein